MEGRGAGGKGEDTVVQIPPSNGNGDTDSAEPNKGNFFDYEDTLGSNVWDKKFTSTLRKGRCGLSNMHVYIHVSG